MSRTVDNNGIGALYATFNIHKTGDDYDLEESNVGDAVVLSGSNQINHGSNGGQLLGRLEHVSGSLATVQIRGVARFRLKSGMTAPGVGNSVVVDGAGEIYQAPAVAESAGDPAGGNIAHGTTIAVDGTSTGDLLL